MVEKDVQGEEVVILGMLVTVGLPSGAPTDRVGDGVQEENERRKTKDAMRYFLNGRMGLLIDLRKQLIEGCHPRDGVDEVCQRGAFFA